MELTLESKINEFIESSKTAFYKQSLNDARQSAEAFCKIILLKEFSQQEANQIINNQHPIIKKYDFNVAIDSILFKNKIKNNKSLINKKVKSYLTVLQNHGNLKSHNDDFSKLDITDIEFGLYHLKKLINYLYVEYFRESIPEELEKLLSEYTTNIQEKIKRENSSWLDIVNITNNFNNQQQRFMLITDKCKNTSLLSNLANVNWSYIGDFDRESHINGLYANLQLELSQYRDCNIITLNDTFDYSKSITYWEFLDGYIERDDTLTAKHRPWQRVYINSGKIKKHIDELYTGGISNSDIFIFIFWENKDSLDYLFDYLNIFDGIFLDSVEFIFLSTNKEIRDEIESELNGYENIKSNLICDLSIENFSLLLKNRESLNHDDIIILPALIEGKESSIGIKAIDFLRYQDDLKIFPYYYDNDSVDCHNYYRGELINYKKLHNECDIERIKAKEIESKVRNLLKERNSQLFYLLSEPSSGATSIAYRVLWNIRESYPSIELLHYKRNDTYIFLQKIYTETNKPLLILADRTIHEEDINKLIFELKQRSITYIILYIVRFLDSQELNKFSKKLSQNNYKKPFEIREKLEKKENDRFYRKLSQLHSGREEELLTIRNGTNSTPFMYNFSLYLDEYKNIDKYIEERIEPLNEFQKSRIKYLALIQYYTGLDTTIKFLTKKTNKDSLVKGNLKHLIVFKELEDELKISFIHNTICKKTLMFLSNVSEQRAWKQKLVEIGIEFLDFLEKEHSSNKNNEVIKDITNRLFIKRNIASYDSESSYVVKYYTDFIEDLKITDAREKIFIKLIQVYPEDRHYLAHLGRFYSVDRKNLEKALEYIDKAIQIAENEGNTDSILYHMKGMVYFRALKEKKRTHESLDEIITLAKESAKYFTISREYDNKINNEYPFISHAQVLIEVLDYGKKFFEDNIYKFIEEYRNDNFISSIIDDIENLISDFDAIGKKDDYSEIKKIQTRLMELQGDIGKSLEILNNLLHKNTYYHPILKRNIARLTIKKYKDNIDSIPEKTVIRLISQLEENLNSFSLQEANTTDLLLWLRLIRHKNINLGILDIIDILSYIKSILEQELHLTKVQKTIHVITLYYLHIIKFIQYDNGDNDVYSEFIEIKNQLKNKSIFLDGNSRSREWLFDTQEKGIKKIINRFDSRLIWDDDDKFFNINSQKYLYRCEGIIKEVRKQATGVINYKNINIHFAPKTSFTKNDINKKVSFFLSFSYDEMKASEVRKV